MIIIGLEVISHFSNEHISRLHTSEKSAKRLTTCKVPPINRIIFSHSVYVRDDFNPHLFHRCVCTCISIS